MIGPPSRQGDEKGFAFVVEGRGYRQRALHLLAVTHAAPGNRVSVVNLQRHFDVAIGRDRQVVVVET